MAEISHCPTCGRRARRGDFLCPACETILNELPVVEDPEPPTERNVMRAMLSPPEPMLKNAVPQHTTAPGTAPLKGSTTKTRLFTVTFGLGDVPVVAVRLPFDPHSLSLFEAYLVSQVDGSSTVEQLRHNTGLTKVEIQSVVQSLVVRRILKIVAPGRKPGARRQTGSDMPYDPPTPLRRPAAAPPPTFLSDAPTAPRGFPSLPARKVPQPRPVEAPLQKAIRLELEGKVDAAIRVLEQAISGSSDPAPLYNRLALVLIKEQRDLVGAEAMLHKALERDPENDVYAKNLLKVLSMASSITSRRKRPKR